MTRPQVRWMVRLAGLVLAASTAPGIASAADDQPPVAAPDEVTLLPGGSKYVDVMANDSDDLDQQALCRVRGNSHVQSGVDRGEIWVDVDTDQPGDYQVQYQACDYDYLSVGTVTVHAVAPQDLVVDEVDGEPGVLHVMNPNPVRVLFYWGGLHEGHPDGHFSLRAGAGKDFTATRHHIFWIALDPSSHWDDGSIVGYGEIRGIDLPAPGGSAASGLPRWAALVRTTRSDRASGGRGALTSATWPTDPTTVEPPTPKTDTIHWWSGSWDRVPVTRNDTDPQGQDVDVCRLAPEAGVPSLRSALSPYVLDGQLDVGTARRVSGTFELPYYVCNSGRLAPAVLRVVLVQAKPLHVTRLADRPHYIRLRNPNPDRVTYVLGRAHADLVYGRLAPHENVAMRAPLGAHRWKGFIGRHDGYAGHGLITQG